VVTDAGVASREDSDATDAVGTPGGTDRVAQPASQSHSVAKEKKRSIMDSGRVTR